VAAAGAEQAQVVGLVIEPAFGAMGVVVNDALRDNGEMAAASGDAAAEVHVLHAIDESLEEAAVGVEQGGGHEQGGGGDDTEMALPEHGRVGVREVFVEVPEFHAVGHGDAQMLDASGANGVVFREKEQGAHPGSAAVGVSSVEPLSARTTR